MEIRLDWKSVLISFLLLRASVRGVTDYSESTFRLLERVRGSNMKVYAFHNPPNFIIKSDSNGNATYGGFNVEILQYIAQRLNLKIEFVIENATEVAQYGALRAAINALIEKKVDVYPRGLTPNVERRKQIDYTNPSFIVNFQMMFKWPEEEGRLSAVIKPFEYKVWYMMIVSALAVIGAVALSSILYRRWNIPGRYFSTVTETICDEVMYFVSVLASQGWYIPYSTRLSPRLMLSTWLLMMVVLINSYTGTFTSQMAVPRLKRLPYTLQELANSSEYQITVEKNAVFAEMLLSAERGPYKSLGDSLRRNPRFLFEHYEQAAANVLNYGCVSVESSIAIPFRIGMDLKKHGKCRLTMSKPLDYQQMFGYALTKDSIFTPFITKELQGLLENGIGVFLINKYAPNIDKCRMENFHATYGRARPFKLDEFTSVFLVLGMGLGCALFSFLLEIIGFRHALR